MRKIQFRSSFKLFGEKKAYVFFSIILSFYSCLFVQCQPNLNNVAAVFAGTSCYQKFNQFKTKIAEKWPDFAQATLYWIFSCAILSGASRTVLHRIFPCNIVSGVLRWHQGKKWLFFYKNWKIKKWQFSTPKTIYFNMHLTKSLKKFQFGFNLPFFWALFWFQNLTTTLATLYPQ